MRKIYEKINLYVYLFVPLSLIVVHHLLKKYLQMNLLNTNSFSDKSFDFVLTMLGVLLTIFGLMFTLPDNEYRKLMKKYNHDKIIFNTIFSGITSSLIFIILNFSEIATYGQEILFIIIFSEVAVSTWWIFRTLKAINS